MRLQDMEDLLKQITLAAENIKIGLMAVQDHGFY